jgi:hypothetical protein
LVAIERRGHQLHDDGHATGVKVGAIIIRRLKGFCGGAASWNLTRRSPALVYEQAKD